MFHRACVLLAVSCALPALADMPPDPWPGYPVVMWRDHPAEAWDALARQGATAGKVFGQRDDAAPVPAPPEPFASGTAFYVENIATDFYAPYHRWTPDRPADRVFDAERAAETFVRDPSLSDPDWQARIAARLARVAHAYAPFKPLYYSLGDETGIADLAAFWDFDVSAASQAGFRGWLRGQYAGLAALNAEWGTAYAAWEDVRPELTDAAMARTDEDFAAWSDFKEWMDEAFARAVCAGTAALHAADPGARAAIEGAQVPGWGGYDYARLAPCVDVMEIYDQGGSLALARAFNPALIPLGTVFGADAASRRAVWRALLRGGRGSILWDDSALAPDLFADVGRAAGWIAGLDEPESEVAVLYSPASLRAQWMLDQRPKGPAWRARTAETEHEDNPARAAFVAALDALQRIGLRPRILSPAALAAGGLSARVLILPRAWALSDPELEAIRDFQAAGGQVLADGPAGLFDGHLRGRGAPKLAPALDSADPDYAVTLAQAVFDAGVRSLAWIASRDAEAHVLRDGAGWVLAVQRDLGSPDGPRTLVLSRPAAITDLDTGAVTQASGWTTIELDPVRPTFLRIAP